MKTHMLFAVICLSLLAPSLFGQTNAPAESTSTVTTPPPIPETARKHFVMGATLFKDAKTPDDYLQVVGEFKQAADLAPQWPEARYNLALAKEAAGDYSGAMDDLKLYQQFKLSNDEARTVQDKIYALEAKQAKAAEAKAKESSPEAVAAKQQDEYDAWLKKLDGAKFSYTRSCNVGTEAATGSPVIAQTLNLVIRGKHVISSSAMICANGHHLESGPWAEPFEFEGNTFIQQAAPGYKNNVFTISDDGAFITYFMPSMGDKWVFTRQ